VDCRINEFDCQEEETSIVSVEICVAERTTARASLRLSDYSPWVTKAKNQKALLVLCSGRMSSYGSVFLPWPVV
jgi:hypothetical protein